MKNHLIVKFVALVMGTMVLVCGGTAQAGTATIGDATHSNFSPTVHDWENVLINTPNDPSIDGYLQAEWETDTNYTIGVSWINSTVSFSPAVMADPLAFSTTWKMDNTGDVGGVVSAGFNNYFPVLEQDGKLYRKVGNHTQDSNGVNAFTHVLTGAAAWGEILPTGTGVTDVYDGSSNPDFSSGGSAITFGLHQWGGSTAGIISPSATATTVLADFEVTIDWITQEDVDGLVGTIVAHYDADLGVGIGDDPENQGWTRNGIDGIPTTGVDDGGVLAWKVDDDNEGGGTARSYISPVSLAQHLSGAENGWKLSGDIRFEEPNPDSIAINMIYGNGSRRYIMWLDMDVDGNLLVVPTGGGTLAAGQDGRVTTDGMGDDAYHHYEIVHNPILDQQQLLVDGVLIYEDLNGQANGQNSVTWGSGSSGGRGVGYYNDVKFEILIPEPSSLALCGLVFISLAGLRRRN